MARYMPQDLFNMLVVSAVKYHVMTGDSLDHICTNICGSYLKYYPDDADVEQEIEKSADKLLEKMQSQFKYEQLPSAMTQLQFCIVNYRLDGKKKRKRILGGAWFSRSKSLNPNRAEDCFRNVLVYLTGTITGLFPMAPSGWSMSNR